MYSNEVLDRIDEGIDSEFTWTVATMKALTAEVRRLTEMVRIREEAIHRLNDELDAARQAEDPWNKVCHRCNNPNCMLRQDCEH